MEDEIEDIVGDVKLSESQKSVATTLAYSLDFTDSCTDASERNNSSGKETYVIEKDDSDDSGQPFQRDKKKSLVHVKDKGTAPIVTPHHHIAHQSTSVHQCTLVHEIFTQTSRTVIELADVATTVSRKNNLETQTSFVSIMENKTVEYRVSHLGSQPRFTEQSIVFSDPQIEQPSKHTLTDSSSRYYYGSRPRLDYCKSERTDGNDSADSSNAIKPFSLSKHSEQVTEYRRDTSETEDSSRCSDMDEDSLIESNFKKNDNHKQNLESLSEVSDVPKSIDNEVDELYKKLYESIQQNSSNKSTDNEIQSLRRLSTLTPLTEESTLKKDSQGDVTSKNNKTIRSKSPESAGDDVLFVSNTGIKVRVLKSSGHENEGKHIKLPPIQKNQSCPNSPHLNFLFSLNTSKPLNKAGTMPCLLEGEMENPYTRWDMIKDLGSGESPMIGSNVDSVKSYEDIVHLPPIQVVYPSNKKFVKELRNHPEPRHHEPRTHHEYHAKTCAAASTNQNSKDLPALHTPISINDKINELKEAGKRGWSQFKSPTRRETEGHCSSPEATSSSSQSDRISIIAEKGCEALCVETLQKLKSSSWYEVADTLQEIPKIFDKFWGVLSENRTADLIRQVSTHIESPRTQVARSACQTLADVLKNTNYTKKPDFYEAMTLLLSKTGSFSRAVRRAANIALDEIVCNVDYSHAITALCIHGVRHKSSIVRCAAARLLVVGCAVAGGGRRLLRTKPVRVTTARSRTLAALSILLDDKCADARKYAERLYMMLRPLPNFEAFYLTDVDVDNATRQMKKYDQLLLKPPKDR